MIVVAYSARALLTACLLWAFFAYPGSAVANPYATGGNSALHEGVSYRVKKVIDGDTIELTNGVRVRYIGINAPETHKKTDGGWESVREPFGEQARKFNKTLVEGKSVRITFDTERIDRYGRNLGYVYAGDIFVNARLLKEGLAYPYLDFDNQRNRGIFLSAFRDAFTSRKNLYAQQLDPRRFRQSVGETGWYTGMVTAVRRGREPVITTGELDIAVKRYSFAKHPVSPGRRIYAFGRLSRINDRYRLDIAKPFHIFVD